MTTRWVVIRHSDGSFRLGDLSRQKNQHSFEQFSHARTYWSIRKRLHVILTSPHAVCRDRPWWNTDPLPHQAASPPNDPWRGGCDRTAPLALHLLYMALVFRMFSGYNNYDSPARLSILWPHPYQSWHRTDLNRKPGRTWPYRRQLLKLALESGRSIVLDIHSFQPGKGRIGRMTKGQLDPLFLLDHCRLGKFGRSEPSGRTLDLADFLGRSFGWKHPRQCILCTRAGDIRQELFEATHNPNIVVSIEFNSTLTRVELERYVARIADWLVLQVLLA
jgi:hypothetical protein